MSELFTFDYRQNIGRRTEQPWQNQNFHTADPLIQIGSTTYVVVENSGLESDMDLGLLTQQHSSFQSPFGGNQDLAENLITSTAESPPSYEEATSNTSQYPTPDYSDISTVALHI